MFTTYANKFYAPFAVGSRDPLDPPLVTGLINDFLIANFNPENPGIGTAKSRDFGIGKRAGIPGFRD